MTRWTIVLPAALAACTLAGIAAGAGESPALALRRAEARYASHVLVQRPDLATRLGLHAADDRLVPVTEPSLDRDRAELAALRAEISGLAFAKGSANDAVRLDSLRARVDREWRDLSEDRWRREPGIYLGLVRDGVLDVAEQPRVSPCERARRALLRLRSVPEVLRAAMVNLRATPGFDRERELERWTGAMFDLRTRVPEAAAACHDPARQADLVEADSLALAAATRFVEFLRDELDTTRTPVQPR